MPSTKGSVFFVLWGAVLVFSMHGGFAFLEAGSVRRKNVADSLTRIITDWAISTVMYFAIGWPIAYGTWMYASAAGLVSANQGFNLVHFFFLLTFAACAPAIISGGISERVRSIPVMLSTVFIVALIYPFFESMVWGQLGVDCGFAVERHRLCNRAISGLQKSGIGFAIECTTLQ